MKLIPEPNSPHGVEFKIHYSHGDADFNSSDTFFVAGDLQIELIEELYRELMLLKECISTSRYSGKNSHLPDSLLNNGCIKFSNGREFYPELDQSYSNTYAEIDWIEMRYANEAGEKFRLSI